MTNICAVFIIFANFANFNGAFWKIVIFAFQPCVSTLLMHPKVAASLTVSVQEFLAYTYHFVLSFSMQPLMQLREPRMTEEATRAEPRMTEAATRATKKQRAGAGRQRSNSTASKHSKQPQQATQKGR